MSPEIIFCIVNSSSRVDKRTRVDKGGFLDSRETSFTSARSFILKIQLSGHRSLSSLFPIFYLPDTKVA
jgi:hypothetical protein